MLIRNLMPFQLGTQVCSRRPPQPEMTIVVRGAFSLRPGEPLRARTEPAGHGFLTAEVFREDDDERRGMTNLTECDLTGADPALRVACEIAARRRA